MSPNRESVPARYLPPEEFFKGQPPAGSWTIMQMRDGRRLLNARLPGDCGCTCPLKPESPDGWSFNEDMARPTLSPSVLVHSYRGQQKHEAWHGWLRNGEWVSC